MKQPPSPGADGGARRGPPGNRGRRGRHPPTSCQQDRPRRRPSLHRCPRLRPDPHSGLFQIGRHARFESLEARSSQLVLGKLDALDSHIALEMRVESVHHRAVTAGAGLVDDAIAIEYEGGSCHRGKTSLGYVSGVFSRCGHSTIETSPMRWRFRGKRTAGDGRARAPTWQLGSLVTARSPKHDKLFSIFGQKVEL